MNSFRILKKKIEDATAKICVVGMGYVGLPLAVAFAKKGYFVYGFDTSASRIEKLKGAEQYIVDVSPQEVSSLIEKQKFIPTAEENVLETADVIIVCVPTPLRKVKFPDISYVVSSSETIKKYLHKGELIILESTSYPTTTREVVLPILKKTGLKEEEDFFLCFSPERVNPGDAKFPLTKIAKIVGGLSDKSTLLAKSLYSKIIPNVWAVSSPEVAETSKLLENTFRLVNIALANEFAMVCDKLGISIWEVIEAAKTKPFGFMPFYPGPGIGGHCLGGSEAVVVKDKDKISLKSLKELFEEERNNGSIYHSLKGIDYLKPDSLQILSFDLENKQSIFKPITILSSRKIEENALRIITNDNRKLILTDKHPVIVEKEGTFVFKWAKELKEGEAVPFVTYLPNGDSYSSNEIDLIKELEKLPLRCKVRLKGLNFSWRNFKDKIKKLSLSAEKRWDYLRHNYLPLEDFIEAEKQKLFTADHRQLILCCGRGPSYSEITAVIDLDNDLWRLIGYYLAEGCITKDKSLRVRWTFNIDEKECIEDITAILDRKKIKYSLYKPKKDKTLHIKVSSNIIGTLFKDILKCGTNSYTMKIPDKFFTQPHIYQQELLKGILRGDGGVDVRIGKRDYIKNGKEYSHESNTATISYYSASKTLFQQLIYLFQARGIVPSFKKRDNLICINGYSQLKKFNDIFLDVKKRRLEKFFDVHKKTIPNRSFTQYEGFATAKIKRIEQAKTDRVYSIEVKDTNTFVTSYGIVVHNCIPCDPLYLSWKAKKLGFKTKMIDLASYINHFMPNYVIEKTESLLAEKNISLKSARILILGVTYKKDVKDLRESPSLDIIEGLHKKEVSVDYFDPFVPYLKIGDIDLECISLTKNSLNKYDCIILVTDHSNTDYSFVQRNAKLIFDTRNVYKKNYDNVVKL